MLQWHPRVVRLLLFALVVASFVGRIKRPFNLSW
jgi:hypothetical protein